MPTWSNGIVIALASAKAIWTALHSNGVSIRCPWIQSQYLLEEFPYAHRFAMAIVVRAIVVELFP